MCVIVAGENKPDTTKLYSVPVIIDNGVKSTLSIYSNNFNVHPDTNMDGYSLPSMLKKPTISGLYYNVHGQLVGYPKNELSDSQSFGSHTRGGAIMIVPYPIERDISNPIIGLVDVSTDKMKKFQTDVKNLKPIARSMTDSFNAKPLEVYKIGSYNISVALGFSDLQTRLDWTKFTKPSDFEVRIRTLANPKLFPQSYRWFYVVAEAINNIKDDGFGVVYSRLSADLIYFPTAHEQRETNISSSDYNFDYECFGYSLRPKKQDGIYNMNSSQNDRILKPLENLKNLEFIDLNKNILRLNPDPHINNLSIIEQDGSGDNHNWFI